MEFNGQQIPDDLAKELATLTKLDLPQITSRLGSVLTTSRKYMNEEQHKQIDDSLRDLSKATDLLNKIRV